MRFLRSIIRTLDLTARLCSAAEQQTDPRKTRDALLAVLEDAVASGLLGRREPPAASEPAAMGTPSLTVNDQRTLADLA